MITYDYVMRKMLQKRMSKRFMHKTKYGKALGEKWGYDERGHSEHYNKIKDNPDLIAQEYFKL